MGFSRRELAITGTAAALVFSRVFGLSVVLPTFRSHYEAAFLVDALWIGVAFGAHGLTMALMQLPLGWLSDRVGRRPVLVAASIVFVVGSVLAMFAGNVWLLIGARLLQGLGAVGSVAMAMVGETVPEERRTTAMALVGIPAGIGFFVGVAAGPLLAPLVGTPGLFGVTAAIGVLAVLPLLFVRPGHVVAVEGGRAWSPRVLALASVGFTMNFALQTVLFFLPDASPALLLPVLTVALLVMGGASRAIDKRGGTWAPIAVGLGILAAGAAAFGLTSGLLPYLIAGTVFFAAHATLSAAVPSQVSRAAGRSGGRGHGIQNIVAYTGTFAGGTVAGAVAGMPWVAFATLGALAAGSAAALALTGDARTLKWGNK